MKGRIRTEGVPGPYSYCGDTEVMLVSDKVTKLIRSNC